MAAALVSTGEMRTLLKDAMKEMVCQCGELHADAIDEIAEHQATLIYNLLKEKGVAVTADA